MGRLRLVIISDTHLQMGGELPYGDVLIHAGDHAEVGSLGQVAQAAYWLYKQPHAVKIAIAGNHDFLFEKSYDLARRLFEEKGIRYLQDEGTQIDTQHLDRPLLVWGSPWQPFFHDWAFQFRSEEDRRKKYDLIPDGIDILVTHGPPYGILDRAPRDYPEDLYGEVDFHFAFERVGCKALLDAVRRVSPGLHVFGHIHNDYGIQRDGGTLFVNASICNEKYRPENKPVVVEYENGRFDVAGADSQTA